MTPAFKHLIQQHAIAGKVEMLVAIHEAFAANDAPPEDLDFIMVSTAAAWRTIEDRMKTALNPRKRH